MQILGISGSLRQGSHNLDLLRAAAVELPPAARFEVWEGLRAVPPYDQDQDQDPGADDPTVRDLRDSIGRSDGLVIATPEYNGSVPGQLKNALDWASRPFLDNSLGGKPVAVIGTSTGLFGAVWAQAELRKVLATIGADVIDEELPVGRAHEAFDANGQLRDPDLRAHLAGLMSALVRQMGTPVENLAA